MFKYKNTKTSLNLSDTFFFILGFKVIANIYSIYLRRYSKTISCSLKICFSIAVILINN